LTESRDRDSFEIDRFQYHLQPGYIFFSPAPTLIFTVMGAAVTVCLWDRQKRIGGASHFQYPRIAEKSKSTARYGNVAIPALIQMLIQEGSEKSTLEAQIFGGGDRHSLAEDTLGQQNVAMARKILARQGIPVVSEDVGGAKGRKLIYKSDTNEAVVFKVDQLRKEDWPPYVLRDPR
jgi:chemotaxis protein CheD